MMEKIYIDEFSLAWLCIAMITSVVAMAVIPYLMFEMQIATLQSYVMAALVDHPNRKGDKLDEIEHEVTKQKIFKSVENVATTL